MNGYYYSKNWQTNIDGARIGKSISDRSEIERSLEDNILIGTTANSVDIDNIGVSDVEQIYFFLFFFFCQS